MIERPLLSMVDLDAETIGILPCCGVKNLKHTGRVRKNCWMAEGFANGLRAKVLLTTDNRQCGYIEYLPGEFAWRGVDAAGYMFIHCIWTFFREMQHKGFGSLLIEACVKDARKAGSNGVAVVARESPWLAKPDVFLNCGFQIVDTAPPDYQLLVRKFKLGAPDPSFRGDWDKKLKKYSRGLTIIRSNQCPHIAKFADEIAETAELEYGLKPRVVELKSCREAQDAPTPYAVFAIIHNGRLLADHQISRTRFRNIMKKLPPRGI